VSELSEGNPELIEIIRAEIERDGPITFARYMELALYHPDHGYYLAAERRPGRPGDFLTAPEMHPFFGLTIANQVHECWERLGRPQPFTIVEYGSGVGGLAWDVMAGLLDREPDLRPHLRYRLNEANAARTAEAMAGMASAGFDDVVHPDEPGEPIIGVVLANEVADAMPVHRLRWTGAGFEEYRVTWDPGAGFSEVAGPLSDEVAACDPAIALAEAGVDLAALPNGARLEVSPAAAAWISEVAARIERGYALVVDYGYPAAELYAAHRLESTVRAYRGHTVTDDPYLAPGEQDLTAHVDFSALARAAVRAGMTQAGLVSQADFLANAGLGDLLVRLQQEPDLAVDEYYRAQAAVFRLIDPGGMGRFRVLGLARNAPVDPPLIGFAGPTLPESLRL
jgi:SAM-dependent MidA family methyltransferase